MTCFDIFKPAKRRFDRWDDDSIHSSSPLVEEKRKADDDESISLLDTSERLTALRKLMEDEGIQVYVVPSEDEHSSEYTSIENQRRSFISGFTGSTGVAIITSHHAHLFTDGRYWVQAAKQLDHNWTLHKVPLDPDWDDWLVEESTKQGDLVIGIDPKLVQYARVAGFVEQLHTHGSNFIFPSRNLIDVVWGEARPAPVKAPVYIHPLEYAGQSSQEKLLKLASWLKTGGDKGTNNGGFPIGSAFIINELDQNCVDLESSRGKYTMQSPEGDSYKATLFISPSLLSSESKAYQYVKDDLSVHIRGYDGIWEYLHNGEWTMGNSMKLICGEKVSWAIVDAVGKDKTHILSLSPIALWKAVKNEVEIQGMRNAYLRDGVCWVKWAAWLDEAIRKDRKQIDEKQASDALIEERKKADKYAGMESYEAISASGEDAALPHFETPEKGSRLIDRSTPYLMDAGAQYYDGTIDTTRTVHFGKATSEQKRAFTRVLQGHIAIETSIFPKGTTGYTLDVLARDALWKDGMNYAHGTGHGIGAFLNVHEGPQGFSTSSGGAKNPTALLENMCISNEPGFYEEGSYGIRIESILRVKKVHTRRGFNGSDNWLGFERLTVVPIDINLVDPALLSKEELTWLRDHNRDCKEKLKPLLKHDKRALQWLQKQ